LFTNIKGDLLSAFNRDDVVAIAHQVNCKGVMGAGLAKQIKNSYPEVFAQYKMAHDKVDDLLGKIQVIETENDKAVVNMFSQYGYGRDKRYTDYQALQICLIKLRDSFEGAVAIPKFIGCGLAGGDWNKVKNIIKHVYSESDKQLYIYSLK